MTICWQVPYGSTAVFVVLRYHGSTVTSTVLLVPWKKVPRFHGSTPTLLQLFTLWLWHIKWRNIRIIR